MSQKPLISVIVPVYNVEPYLDRCIQSIVEQTYENLEIILVDDGSPDNCPAVCDAWAEKDNRIRVIHKVNGGLSDARNVGMAIATGELIGFVDSDDWISPDMYQLLYDRMMVDSSDITACGVEMVWDDSTLSCMLTASGSYVLNTEEAMAAIIQESCLKQPVWYKLYKTDLIRDISFPVGKCHEDVFWSYQAIGRSRRVSVFDQPCYFYRQRNGSIMGNGYSLRRLDALEAKVARLQYIQQHIPTLLNLTKRDLWFSCIYMMQMLLKYCKPDIKKTGSEIIYGILQVYPIRINPGDRNSVKQLIWLTMARFSLGITCKLRNLLQIGM